MLGSVGGDKDGLEAVVVLVPDRLELVRVTAGALNGYSQQAVHRDLEIAFQHAVLVRADLIGVAIALAGAVWSIAQEVRRRQQFDRLSGDVAVGPIAG